ncbi:MAG TPA: ribosome-associated translation inhibitor RaiA [Gemmatimonadales bacterium]|nr:ribosome-associated translation inhibitor RaiA [Gemmatimonadales bacterium]
MHVTITARHCDIPDALRTRAESVMDRLGNYGLELAEGAIIFDVEALRQRAEVRLRATTGEMVVAKDDGPDHRTALDRAEEKLKRQLKKAARRIRDRRRPEADAV